MQKKKKKKQEKKKNNALYYLSSCFFFKKWRHLLIPSGKPLLRHVLLIRHTKLNIVKSWEIIRLNPRHAE